MDDTDSRSDDDLLVSFQRGNREDGDLFLRRFTERLFPRLWRQMQKKGKVGARAESLNLADDVCSQMCLAILEGSSPFDPERGSLTTYLWFQVRIALRQVLARICPPGMTTRPPKRSDSDVSLVATTALYLTDIQDLEIESGVNVEQTVASDLDIKRFIDAVRMHEHPAMSTVVTELLHGRSVVEAARAAGISRDVANRAFRRMRQDSGRYRALLVA